MHRPARAYTSGVGALAAFIAGLAENGRVTVGVAPAVADDADRAAVRAAGEAARAAAPGEPPVLDPVLATWAFARLHDVCRFVIHRQFGREAVEEMLTRHPPSGDAWAARAFSVDVAFRHLPEAYALAERTSGGDPLLDAIRALVAPWPLSAVGVPGTAPDPGPLLRDPCLARLYVDRVLAARDRERAAHPAVRPLVAAALGAHARCLLPEFADLVA